MREIDRIIREAKEQKRKVEEMNISQTSESSLSESGFGEKYLMKQSEITN